jgi:hypothetical protein
LNSNHQEELKRQQTIILQHQSDLIETQNEVKRQKQQWDYEIKESKSNYSLFETKAKKLEELVMELQAR